MTSACAGAKLSIRAATVATATRRLLADGVIEASGEGPPERLDYDYLVSLNSMGPMPRRIAEWRCTTLAAFRWIPASSTIFESDTVATPQRVRRERSSWRPYLALGYRLSGQRDKLAASKSASLSFP